MKNLILISIAAVVVLGIGYLILKSPSKSLLGSVSNSVSTSTPTFSPEQQEQTTSKLFEIQNIKVEILEEGTGQAVKSGDKATVNYVGGLEDGTKFDSSYDRGIPLSFNLGAGEVIQGWDLGVAGMKVGEKRKLTIPSDLGYGSAGYGPIPPNATLIFEVELLGINQ